MQAHVEQPELDLPHHRERGTGVAAFLETLENISRQRRPRFGVRRTAFEHLVVPGKVLHELAGQFDRIPRHAIDARDARVVDARQQVVQHVAELVKHGYHVVMSEQRAAAVVRRRKIADEETDRVRHRAVQVLAVHAVVHPRARALAAAREQVGIEAAHLLAIPVVNPVVKRVLVPRCDIGVAQKADAIEPAGEFEETAHHGVGGKILPQDLVRDGELLLLELFEQKGKVPGFHGHARKLAQLRQLGFGRRPRTHREVAQEADDLSGRLRHLGGERIIRVAVETDEFRRLVAQRQDLLDVVAVVPLVVRALVRRAGHPAVVEGFAQAAVLGVRHDGVIGREIEGQQPAVTVALRSLSGGALLHLRRQPLEFGGIVDRQRPRVRGVLDVVVEIGLYRGERLHDLPEALLLLVGKINARQAEIPQGMGDGVPACLVGVRRQAAVHPGVRLLQPGVL